MKAKYIIVDLTSCTTPDEVIGAFVDVKVNNSIAIQPYELQAYADHCFNNGVLALMEQLNEIGDILEESLKSFLASYNVTIKKIKTRKPWYKRLWNWIRRK